MKVVWCKNCIYWKPPHILLNDGTERDYTESEKKSLFSLVPMTVGINVGAQCTKNANSGYDCDKTIFMSANDYCSKGVKKEEAEKC